MEQLVIHHTYMNGVAFDTSNHRNHGIPIGVANASPPLAPSFKFSNSDSQVIVNPSASMNDLIALRAVVKFLLSPSAGIQRRYNLMEGHLSFALFIGSDGSLNGTILDQTSNWLGAKSQSNAVSVGQ